MMNAGLQALSIEHCRDPQFASAGLRAAVNSNVAAHIDLDSSDRFDRIPDVRPSPENSGNVEHVRAARNMLVSQQSRAFGSKREWLAALQSTNYDVLLVDAFYNGNEPLSKEEVHSLKFKQIGARRQVYAIVNAGYAEDQRCCWQRDWQIGSPTWIKAYHDSPGQYVIEFWNPAWKAIIGRYLEGVIDLGFDGVVLDGVEAYRRWEFQTPVDPKTSGLIEESEDEMDMDAP